MNDILRSQRPAMTRRILPFARRRTLAVLLTLAAAFGWVTPPAAAQSPTPASPAVPTPYSWPGFHAGGASPQPFSTTPSTGYAGTLTPFVPDALFGMLQGTPTGIVTSGGSSYDAQIPSYLLGNYVPAQPPAASATVFPNHFADDIFSIPSTVNVFYAPFPSVNQILNASATTTGNTVTVDDQSAAGFTRADGTVHTANNTPYNFTWQAGLADGTATDGSAGNTGATYSRIPVAVDTGGNPLTILTKVVGGVVTQTYPTDKFATATWTLTASTAGTYTVSLNLPAPVDNGTTSTAPNKPEYRIPDAHYVIRNGIGTVVANTRITQTETNSPQFLAGPFPLQAGEALTVTLDNSTLTTVTDTTGTGQTPANTYVLADSMTLTPAGGAGDVQSSPVAVNASEYPEIANALYFGYQVTADTTTIPTTYTYTADNTTPYGNATIGTTPPNAFPATTAERRRIRQLVYFGRSESVLSQDAVTGELTAQPVGAIYCVDGNSGGVVWRYQTGGAVSIQNTGYLATGLSGTVKSLTAAGPQPFQIGPAAYATTAETGAPIEGSAALATPPGRFGSYTAFDAAAPQLTGADLSKYGFSLYATTATPVDATHVLYTGTFRIYADGYGYKADGPTTQTAGLQILEHGSFSVTATFTDAYNATLRGTLTADAGTLQPAGWPQPVDFAPSGIAAFTGQFHSDTSGNQSISNATLRAGTSTTKSPTGGFVFSTPAVARIHVLVGGTPAAPLYATKLVVIAADNLGYVYCLDALGNRDGTSNTSVIDPTLNQPVYAPQPVFGAAAPVPVTDPTYAAHVGTTNQYWVYRPDPTSPKYISGANAGKVKTYDPDSDLPTPGAFGLASPAIDVQTRLAGDATTLPAAAGATTGVAGAATPTPTDYNYNTANIFIGNSNGTLYKLEALGTPLDNTLGSGTSAIKGDTFNASRDIRANATDPVVPTPRAVWWLPTNLASTNGSEGTDSITSAPALRISQTTGITGVTNIHTTTQVYFTTSNTTLNAGRLYRVDDLGATGAVNSAFAPLTPGSPQYNVLAQAKWGFPRAYKSGTGANQQVRPSLGSIGGSPVLFTNPANSLTRVFIAADVRQEAGDDGVLNAGDAGRIWEVDPDTGLVVFVNNQPWVYPSTNDPNDYTKDTVTTGVEPPIGGFENATPAVGIVQFPSIIQFGSATTEYTHTDAVSTDVKGTAVPMLYVGSVGTSDVEPRLYGIDLNGTDDAQRTIYADQFVPASGTNTAAQNDFAILHSGLISQGGFVSSPALVTNANTTGSGNGGALFITATDNTLYQFDGSPQSNDTSATSTATGPDFGYYQVLRTAGPYSSPAVAAFDATDLNGTTPLSGTTISGNTEVDFVYVGDSATGEMLGVTPSTITNFGSDGGFGGDGGGGGIGGNGGEGGFNLNLPQFPLYVYLFDNKTPHLATSNDMSKANPIGGLIPAFEWGDNVYIRVANVVPPVDATQTANSSQRITLPAAYTANSQYASIFLTNGSPVSIQISETDRLGRISVNQGADVGQVPATLLGTLSTNPPGNGFVRDATGDTEAGPPNTGKFLLRDSVGPYIGAYTYAISNGSARKNTPGSRRRIITATQTAQAYGVNASGVTTFISTVTLTATVRPAGSGHTDPSTGKRVYSQTVDQPTFAILNPLALNGLALPIASISGGTAAPQQVGASLGPFNAVTSPTPVANDLPAFANGNRVYQNVGDIPKNGILGGNASATATPVLHTERVLSTTGLIGHGTSGGTVDPTAPTVAPSPANPPDADGNGLVQIADRSDLGPIGKSLRLTMMPTAMQWNDNSHTGGTGSGDWVNGEGSRINRMPWEDVPTAGRAGQNHSLDYPDIAPTAVRQVLTSNSGKATLTSSAASPDAAGGTAGAQAVRTDRLNVQIRVPKYQPANTQLLNNANGPIAPQEVTGSYSGLNFPMGYTASQMRVFVDSDHNKTYTSGEAYRDLTVYTGVPMDMGMTITSATTDLGALTQGFGVQTLGYTGLDAFDPYSAGYQLLSSFKPITAFNNGNVNLLNVQFDQRVEFFTTAPASDTAIGLPLSAGPLDANSALSGYDMMGVTGPYQSRFTLRSSIDSDMIGVPGKDPRNPGLTGSLTDPFTGTPYNTLYPGVTFHKARPGDGSPSLLRVPDVPHDNNIPAFTVDTAPPNNLPNTGTDTSGYRYSAAPYIGMAVPLGTPVGTYSQSVRLFEGIDPPAITAFDPLKGPTYGGAGKYGGRYTPAVPFANMLTNVRPDPNTSYSPAQPYSTATQVVAKVEEARITDGTSVGTLPHGDALPAGPVVAGSPTARGDFSPAAVRDIAWDGNTLTGSGGINLFWTSSRDASAPAKPPYNVVGRRLNYTVNGGTGYFDSGLTATAGTPPVVTTAATSWYANVPGAASLNALFPDTTGLNTGLTLAQAQHLYGINGAGDGFFSRGRTYAFVQNTAAYGGATTGAPIYRNTIYCLQVDPATGQITDALPDLTAAPAPAFAADARVVSDDPAQAKFGIKGLKLPSSGTSAGTGGTVSFTDPLTGSSIYRDLWAFWGSGARGRSSIAYTSTTTSNTGVVSNTWTPTASLPVPAGLASAADPSPVLTTAPDKNGNAVPAIDVTYTGIGPDGSTDLYVSRYRPYMATAAGAASSTVALALSPFAPVTETLQADPQVINWQARDVAWVRDTTTSPYGINVAIQRPSDITPVSLALEGMTPQYDRATGTLVYTGVSAGPMLTYPSYKDAAGNVVTVTGTVDTVYVDLVRGRVRFHITQTVTDGATKTTRTVYSLPSDTVNGVAVTATFAPEARRITADTAADTEPVTFMDEAFKPNEASFQTNLGRVQANRAWFIWRKAAFSKTAQPTLFYKTQRLTVALTDANGQPISIKLDASGTPQVTVTGAGSTLYSPANAISSNVVDVDWARGRIYFPLSVGTKALEGQPTTVTGTGIDVNGNTVTIRVNPTVQWQDEGRYNDIKFVPDDTSTAVPISAAVNEGTASAFLDPMAYADVRAGAYNPFTGALTSGATLVDQPHKVWLYWSSTRNGTADIYSEAIEPRFSVRLGGGSVP